jgi:hypothetical protein
MDRHGGPFCFSVKPIASGLGPQLQSRNLSVIPYDYWICPIDYEWSEPAGIQRFVTVFAK